MNYQIDYEKNPERIDILKLSRGIADYALEMKGHAPREEFAFFIRDSSGEILGGCNGFIECGCLYIVQLWIDKNLRGKGYGAQLMQMAEKLGKEKRCLFSTVSTMDWEALDFYRKFGYRIEFERHGYTKNSIFYFLKKDF